MGLSHHVSVATALAVIVIAAAPTAGAAITGWDELPAPARVLPHALDAVGGLPPSWHDVGERVPEPRPPRLPDAPDTGALPTDPPARVPTVPTAPDAGAVVEDVERTIARPGEEAGRLGGDAERAARDAAAGAGDAVGDAAERARLAVRTAEEWVRRYLP